MSSDNQRIALVTGSSSGIGLETALYLAKNGFKTYASMRNLKKSNEIKQRIQSENASIEIIQLDVTDDESVKTAINTIVEKEGRVDLLVNNAGYAIIGAVEDLSSKEIKDQFETNVFGVYRVTQEVLPTMRQQKSGRIITISSIAGFSGFPAMSAYVGTKFAVEGFTESLRHEVSPFGIYASVIEPGVIKTNIMKTAPFAKKVQGDNNNSAYNETIQAIGKGIEGAMELMGSPPSVVADAVLQAATAERPEIRYTAGEDAKMLQQARKIKSDNEFEAFVKTGFLDQLASN